MTASSYFDMSDYTLDQVKEVMKKVCPDMLTNGNFMKHAANRYCKGEHVDVKALSDIEYTAWLNLHEVLGTATVGQLVKYLKENFKPTDRLCYMDCVEGCKNDCTYVTKDKLGERFFYYVKQLKDKYKDNDELYPYVNDNDIVVV